MIPLFLLWGSFLNVLSFRIINGYSLLKARSFCPNCKNTVPFYDNIPILSWFLLKGACRYCKKPISFLYPFIEATTCLLLTLLFYKVDIKFFFSYFIFFSALIVSIRSDLQYMLISRFVTLYILFIGPLLAWYKLLPISLYESISGIIFGYFILYGLANLFFYITKKNGMGQGDFELLAFIGSFIGIIGCWSSLLIGSTIGSLLGVSYITIFKKNRSTKIPFGPFLAFGATTFVLFQKTILQVIMPY